MKPATKQHLRNLGLLWLIGLGFLLIKWSIEFAAWRCNLTP